MKQSEPPDAPVWAKVVSEALDVANTDPTSRDCDAQATACFGPE